MAVANDFDTRKFFALFTRSQRKQLREYGVIRQSLASPSPYYVIETMENELMTHGTIQMSNNPTRKQSRQICVHCPVTGEQAKITAIETIFFNGQVKWWRCSICGGWHIVKKAV